MSPVPDKDDPEKLNEEGEIGSMESPDFIIAAGSSDDESDSDDERDHLGYQLLPQDPNLDTNEEEDDHPVSQSPDLNAVDRVIMSSMEASDYVGGFGASMFNVPDVCTEAVEIKQLWSETKNPENDKPLEEEKVEQIRAAMAGFTLPQDNLPAWANTVSDEDWKKQLIHQLHSQSALGKRMVKKASKDCNSAPTTSKSGVKSESEENQL